MRSMRIHAPKAATVSPLCADPVRWKDAPLARELFVLNNLMMRVGDRLDASVRDELAVIEKLPRHVIRTMRTNVL